MGALGIEWVHGGMVCIWAWDVCIRAQDVHAWEQKRNEEEASEKGMVCMAGGHVIGA